MTLVNERRELPRYLHSTGDRDMFHTSAVSRLHIPTPPHADGNMSGYIVLWILSNMIRKKRGVCHLIVRQWGFVKDFRFSNIFHGRENCQRNRVRGICPGMSGNVPLCSLWWHDVRPKKMGFGGRDRGLSGSLRLFQNERVVHAISSRANDVTCHMFVTNHITSRYNGGTRRDVTIKNCDVT